METNAVTIFLGFDDDRFNTVERVMEVRKLVKGYAPGCKVEVHFDDDKIEVLDIERVRWLCPIDDVEALVLHLMDELPEADIEVFGQDDSDVKRTVPISRDKVGSTFGKALALMVELDSFSIEIDCAPKPNDVAGEAAAEGLAVLDEVADIVAGDSLVTIDGNPVTERQLKGINLRIKDLKNLIPSAKNTLLNDNLVFLGELCEKTEAEALRIPNFGRKKLNLISCLLSDYGLRYKYRDEPAEARILNWTPGEA